MENPVEIQKVTENDVSAVVKNPFKKYIPIITLLCCVLSIVLFIGINMEASLENWDAYKKWGAPSLTDIFNGNYWGLITSNFVHVQVWHIVFNLAWLWMFGKKIEFESNKIFFCFLILSSAVVSSVSELFFADTTGIGLSGINYSLFGYIFIKSKIEESYKNYIDKRTTNFLFIWLIVCIVLTKLDIMNVGNAAHIGGLIWGMTIAYTSRYGKYWQVVIAFLLLFVLTTSIFWNPFSTAWLSHEAFKFHSENKIDDAIVAYKKILKRDADNEFAKSNLRQLDLFKLQEKGFKLHNEKKFDEARKVYNEILVIDKDNAWAKENLKNLPQ